MTENDESRGRNEGFRDGVRQGLGVLSALKEAIEDTIEEARQRGDLSADRAREIVRDAMGRAQAAAGQARERLDLVHQRDFEALVVRVEELREEVRTLENRVAHLEDRGEEGGPREPVA